MEEQEITMNAFGNFNNIQKVEFSDLENVEFGYDIIDSSLYITSKLVGNELGTFENRALITYNDITYQIPIIVRVTEATLVIVRGIENELSFQIKHPLNWEYAKITVTNSETFEEADFFNNSK